MTLPQADPTPETTPVVVSPPKGDNQTQQVSQQVTTDWETRYKGLQRTFDALQKKYDNLVLAHDQLGGEVEELRQAVRRHETEKGSTESRVKQLETEKTTLEESLKRRDLEKERMKLIMGDFAELAPFEADGLLPEADTIENLRPKLEAFQKKLGGKVTENVQKKLQGTGPVTGPRHDDAPAHSEEWLYTRLEQLAGRRTPDQETEYQTLMGEWDELHKPK